MSHHFEWLKAEIAKPQYAGLDDAATAAAINAQTYDAGRNIYQVEAVNALLWSSNRDWGSVVSISDGIVTAGVSVETRKLAINVREAMKLPEVPALNTTVWTALLADIDALVTASRMSAGGKAALVALRVNIQKLWMLFGREVEPIDVTNARLL